MKTKISLLLTGLGLALLAVLAIAATTPPVPPPPPAAAPTPAAPPDDFHARMAEKLGLSAEQQKSIDDLRARQRAELQTLGENKELAPEVRRDQARAIVENYRSQMRAVLTPEQQQKVGEWREHLREQAGHRARDFRPRDQGDRPGPGMQPPPPDNPMAIVAMGEHIKDRIAERLQLTDEQRDQLEHLGRAYRAQQREAAEKHREEMRAVLTPEQQQKAEQMKQHFHRGPPGGHPPFLSMNEEPDGMSEAMEGDLPLSVEEI